MIPEPSGPTLQADEAAFAAAAAEAMAATQQRQVEAQQFQEARTPAAGVPGGSGVVAPTGQPPGVSPQPSSSPNVADPHDNSQSQ